MKFFLAILLAVSVFAMVGAPVALAIHEPDHLEEPTDGSPEEPTDGLPKEEQVPTTGKELIGRIGLIGNWVFAIFLAISIIYIILAAFQFVTGGGDPAQISGARQKLIYAAVGIAVALLAAGFDDVLRSILVGGA